MASTVRHALRKTTGLVGLKRIVNAREVLESVYNDTSAVLSKFPEASAYRQKMLAITNDRLNLLKQSAEIHEFENALGQGQIEEVIDAAEDELSLAKTLAEQKVWEPLAENPPKGQWKWP
ncbi:hypothetical protein PTSG_07232 [Salpingoeca rosetta]|uniref:NADH dehydrogenase [ubiquinone] 1 alpha subcomplex subunit 5 n=1 Tax=Salpingoeca rosetta (strain ATCC 50818 / BSB-021) TaxID=946362 RepID=F2UEF8_SALR5|nr:uncharacterized protein PTSG_07232 [Salpingoeca rosetta]EGD75008.1 hypothetical protein PTSG_07232 [Salpingoeca rosetta]|eukprot:XP_004992652.1 hypothetical protein PTSG_07232 [Salpingoeca rosetta]